MATRKVLINRHSTKNEAPIASEMFLGEIAVSHPSEISATTIYTRNGNEMVPFISCAQTISIVSGMIEAVDVVYDVQKKNGEPYINVETGTSTGSKTFTLSTSGVASETNLNALSSATVSNFQNMTNILSALTDVVVTAITGDDIINVTLSDPSTGSSNAYTLTHKEALVTNGFNKLTTDAYGHVTAATAVATADIEALGFKTSADTDEEIAELSGATQAISGYAATQISQLSAGTQHDIETLSGNVVEYVKVVSGNIETVINELSAGTIQLSADTHNKIESVYDSATAYADDAIAAAIDGLDSNKVTTDNRHYVTAITIENGQLSTIGEAEIPVLASAVTGTGNVVTDIAVNDHTITFAKDLTVASDTDLKAVSGIVDTFSAATVAEFTELSGATVSAFTAIQAMDKAADAVAGQVVTTVAETDGVVTETKAYVKDLQLGGYSKDTTATGDIESTDTINAALSKLENKAAAITIANADKSINVTTGATGTDINVNIKSGEHVLAKDGNAGLYTNIKLSALTPSSDLVKEEYALYGTDDTILGDHIKIYKDQSLVSITLEENDGSGHTGQYLKYTYIDASGNTQSTYVNVSSFLVEAEFASGVTADASGVVHGVVDPTSESFLTVGADGFKLSGVQDAIDAKVNALDVTGDTAVAGQYVAAIEQNDGVVAVKTRANVSEAVLNNYAKGSDATAVAATDTVNQAISKLENQVDAAKAAATTKVVEGTDAGNNMTITPTTSSTDGSVTYTVDLTDVASKAALDAEIAARKAVDGQTGQTYAANTGATYITGATSLNDADLKLDTALKAVADQVEGLDYTGLTDENTKVVTDVKQENGLVSASATTVGDLVITAITTADTKVAANDSLATIAGKLQGQIDAMDSTGETTGNGYFLTSVQIEDGKITAATQGDKANSATTAESANTAASADKVANTLSISGYATSESSALDTTINYDGSQAKSLTFGTNTAAGKSMSMTSAGVVDVEIIDCGEY